MLVYMVDDDPEYCAIVAVVLRSNGYDVRTFGDGAAALQALAQQCPDALVLDLVMPGVSGVDVLQRLRGCCPVTQVVLATAVDSFGFSGAVPAVSAYLVKPFPVEDLLVALHRLHPSRATPRMTREEIEAVAAWAGADGQAAETRKKD